MELAARILERNNNRMLKVNLSKNTVNLSKNIVNLQVK